MNSVHFVTAILNGSSLTTLSEVTFLVDVALLRHICTNNQKNRQTTLSDSSLCATNLLPPPEQEQENSERMCACGRKKVNIFASVIAQYKSSLFTFCNGCDYDGQAWIRTEDGVLEPVWFCGAALPNWLVNLLDTGDREEEKEEEEEEENEDGRVWLWQFQWKMI